MMEPTDAMRKFVIDSRSKGMNDSDAQDTFYAEFEEKCDDPDAIFDVLWKETPNAQPAQRQDNRGNQRYGQRALPTNNNQGAKIEPNHLTAPFRFAPLNANICEPEENVAKAWSAGHLHDYPFKHGLCGHIAVRVTFDGPMLIGNGGDSENKPMQLGEKHVIPGATLRGLMRATMEIAAFARLTQTNLHRRYGIRDFKHELFKDEARKDVRAGWLTADGDGGYQIAPCDWWPVRIRDIEGNKSDNGKWHKAWLQKPLGNRYEALDMGRRNGPFDFSKIKAFKIREDMLVPDANGAISGVYVVSDCSPTIGKVNPEELDEQNDNPTKGNQKKTEAVFAALGEAPLPVPRRVWENFSANNSKPSRNKPTPTGNWAKLKPTLDSGNRIPVFWVANQHGEVDDLGLVRVFKRAHRYDTWATLARTGNGVHCVPSDSEGWGPDFVEALFGYVHEPEKSGGIEAKEHDSRHLKGRLAFGFARLRADTPGKIGQVIKTVQSAPKPSFAPFYLAGVNGKDWSRDDVELAGRKLYPSRGAGSAAVRKWLESHQGNGKEDTMSNLHFLEPQDPETKLRFEGEIALHNVTMVELGAVLWVLTFGGDEAKRHMIGRAKTAGAGQAQIEVTDCALVANAGGPAPEMAVAMKAFEEFMEGHSPGWRDSPPLRALLAAADPKSGKSLKTAYLGLKEHAKLRDAVREGRQDKNLLGLG